MSARRLVVAITGASGAIYGVRLLQAVRHIGGVEIHLLVSEAGELNLRQELDFPLAQVAQLADVLHDVRDIGASIASGSFRVDGMVVAPCSMKTLAAIAQGYADNLITRAADVTLKERRRLVLMAREAPLSLIHLRNMAAVTEAGGIIFPPMPAFYHRPGTLEEMVGHTIDRVLDMLGLPQPGTQRWVGLPGGSR